MTLAEVVALAEARLIAPNIEKFKLVQVGDVYGKFKKKVKWSTVRL